MASQRSVDATFERIRARLCRVRTQAGGEGVGVLCSLGGERFVLLPNALVPSEQAARQATVLFASVSGRSGPVQARLLPHVLMMSARDDTGFTAVAFTFGHELDEAEGNRPAFDLGRKAKPPAVGDTVQLWGWSDEHAEPGLLGRGAVTEAAPRHLCFACSDASPFPGVVLAGSGALRGLASRAVQGTGSEGAGAAERACGVARVEPATHAMRRMMGEAESLNEQAMRLDPECGYQGKDKDVKKAVQLYRQAASRGHAEARHNMAVCFENGQGVAVSHQRSSDLNAAAARQGLVEAQFNLGVCFSTGQGVPRNLRRAAKLYGQAVKQEHVPSMVNLAILYENGWGVRENKPKAAGLYERAVRASGDADAQFNLGVMLENGDGVEANPERAVALYRKAAKQEHVAAQFQLGVCLEEGVGVERPALKAAVRWYEATSRRKHAGAQVRLGRLYEEGRGVGRNTKKAVSLYRKASKQDFPEGHNALAVCLMLGRGVGRDPDEAERLLRKASEQGLEAATFNLGVLDWVLAAESDPEAAGLLSRGDAAPSAAGGEATAAPSAGGSDGGGDDGEEADAVGARVDEVLALYDRAVRKEEAPAMVELGRALEEGLGVRRDVDQAVRLYELAAVEGDEDAPALLEAARGATGGAAAAPAAGGAAAEPAEPAPAAAPASGDKAAVAPASGSAKDPPPDDGTHKSPDKAAKGCCAVM